ncbi:putative regulator of cell polarity [Pseudohyphozyma bogoriensis]|nr:putative regulator of cell polarity [Pseudohyphozyma bogoriensis]
MLRGEYKPASGDGVGEGEEREVLPGAVGGGVGARGGQVFGELTISDLQRLEMLAAAAAGVHLATISDSPLETSDDPQSPDSPLIVPPPGQILRRNARTKIRKAGVVGIGSSRFGPSRRNRNTSQEYLSSPSAEDLEYLGGASADNSFESLEETGKTGSPSGSAESEGVDGRGSEEEVVTRVPVVEVQHFEVAQKDEEEDPYGVASPVLEYKDDVPLPAPPTTSTALASPLPATPAHLNSAIPLSPSSPPPPQPVPAPAPVPVVSAAPSPSSADYDWSTHHQPQPSPYAPIPLSAPSVIPPPLIRAQPVPQSPSPPPAPVPSPTPSVGKSGSVKKSGWARLGLGKSSSSNAEDSDDGGKGSKRKSKGKEKEKIPEMEKVVEAARAQAEKEKEREREEAERAEKEREREKSPGFFGGLFGSKKKDQQEREAAANAAVMHSPLPSPEPRTPPPPPTASGALMPNGTYMNFYRLPIHVERAVYRLSHIKLANPRRPLYEQVLISNLMFWYLSIINKPTPPPAAAPVPVPQPVSRAPEDAPQKRPGLTKSNRSSPSPARSAETPIKQPQYDQQHQQMNNEYEYHEGAPPPSSGPQPSHYYPQRPSLAASSNQPQLSPPLGSEPQHFDVAPVSENSPPQQAHTPSHGQQQRPRPVERDSYPPPQVVSEYQKHESGFEVTSRHGGPGRPSARRSSSGSTDGSPSADIIDAYSQDSPTTSPNASPNPPSAATFSSTVEMPRGPSMEGDRAAPLLGSITPRKRGDSLNRVPVPLEEVRGYQPIVLAPTHSTTTGGTLLQDGGTGKGAKGGRLALGRRAYTTFSSISQSSPTASASSPSTTAQLGPSDVPGSLISVYETGGSAALSSASIAATQSAVSGGGLSDGEKLGVGLGVGLGGALLLALVGVWFVMGQRRKTRRAFEKRTEGLRAAQVSAGQAGAEVREASV